MQPVWPNSQTNDSFVIPFGYVLFCFLFLNDHLAFFPQCLFPTITTKPRIPRIIPASVIKLEPESLNSLQFRCLQCYWKGLIRPRFDLKLESLFLNVKLLSVPNRATLLFLIQHESWNWCLQMRHTFNGKKSCSNTPCAASVTRWLMFTSYAGTQCCMKLNSGKAKTARWGFSSWSLCSSRERNVISYSLREKQA